MKRTQILMNKLVYLHLSILQTSKVVMFGFWYNYLKLKYRRKAKLCYMDTDSFIVTVCHYHVTCTLQSESTFCNCLNVKELLPRNRRYI